MTTRALSRDYRRVPALVNCDLEIGQGEVFGLLGPNGSGKTTLLRILLGFLRATRGTAQVAGLDCYRDSLAVRQRLSYLPGDARLFRQFKGHEILRFFASVRRDGSLPNSLALAERLSLDLSRQVAAFSTGMRQKLALAVTLAVPTPLVILDEPTANLDPTVRGEVLKLVREARAAGRTVIFSSHVLEEIEQVCDRLAILREGHKVHEQCVRDLRRQHRIRARLRGPFTPPPPHLAAELTIENRDNHLTILTPGELSPLLGWLATLPLDEVHAEPVGLRAIYDRFHPAREA